MQSKPHNRTDVHWVISSVSLALTLGLWSLFVSQEKRGAGVAGQADVAPQTTDQVVITQPQMLVPGQVLLFGGTAPQPQQQVTVTQTRTKHRGGGGGGATTSTGSSKP